MTRYCYSIVAEHGEFFDAESDTREGAINTATAALQERPDMWPYDPGQAAQIYTAEIVPAEEYLRVYQFSIGTHAATHVDDELTDFIASEEPIVVLTDEQAEHLGRRIIDTLVEYGAFQGWGIKNVVAHDVVVGDAE